MRVRVDDDALKEAIADSITNETEEYEAVMHNVQEVYCIRMNDQTVEYDD